jgi:hypothetical protein
MTDLPDQVAGEVLSAVEIIRAGRTVHKTPDQVAAIVRGAVVNAGQEITDANLFDMACRIIAGLAPGVSTAYLRIRKPPLALEPKHSRPEAAAHAIDLKPDHGRHG